MLPKTRTPWTEFVFSTGTQACLVAFLVWVRLLHPAILSAPEHTFRSVRLVSTPVPANHEPQPLRQLPKPVFVASTVANLDPPADALRLPMPQPKPAKIEDTPAPTVSMAPKKLEPLPLSSEPVIPKVVATNTFSNGSSAPPTLARTPSQVQTGGFGDPKGIPAKPDQNKAVNIAAAGSFDLPSGGGSGNGSGGAKGVSGVVASAGFGGGTAIADNRPRNSALQNTVQQSGFGDADVPAPPAGRAHSAETADGPALPAEIISKPIPAYTQEARNLHIEGEVLLQVVLGASGSLRVVRVVHGLGHGLDDNAVKAAEQIRFKPATRNGQPADSTVVLHIVFQLA
ncbi:MAG: TonB family protein [Candidatus Sulfotelmatobacter sp.]